MSAKLSSPKLFLIASIALYAMCLPANSFCTVQSGCDDWPSFGVLIAGVFTLGSGWSNFLWIANPILFFGWAASFASYSRGIARDTKMVAAVFGYISLALAASFLFADEVVTDTTGRPKKIESVALGYWLWIASMIAFAVGATLNLSRRPE